MGSSKQLGMQLSVNSHTLNEATLTLSQSAQEATTPQHTGMTSGKLYAP